MRALEQIITLQGNTGNLGRKLEELDQEIFKWFKHKKGTYHKWHQGQVINQEYDTTAQLHRNKNLESLSPAGAKNSKRH